MSNVIQRLFAARDGTRRTVREQVASSREKVDRAVNRFEETIRDLLAENDRLTGREHHERQKHHK